MYSAYSWFVQAVPARTQMLSIWYVGETRVTVYGRTNQELLPQQLTGRLCAAFSFTNELKQAQEPVPAEDSLLPARRVFTLAGGCHIDKVFPAF